MKAYVLKLDPYIILMFQDQGNQYALSDDDKPRYLHVKNPIQDNLHL